MRSRSLHKDVSGTVDVTDPQQVCDAVQQILSKRYAGQTFQVLSQLYDDFDRLYSGKLPGYLACETTYHDIQHVLDVTLAMARRIDGYDASQPAEQQLGPELALMGMVIALFHDSGYIRQQGDTERQHGAEYTKTHVSRSAQFLTNYLPSVGLQHFVAPASQLVHFTGYEFAPEEIVTKDPKHRIVGALVGTADVIAQMADVAYLEKCRDRLYPEFELGGMTRQLDEQGNEQVIYASAEDLLEKTPHFVKTTIKNRLEGHFGGLYRYVEAHFGGRNLYMESLENNCRYLERVLARNDRELLVSSNLYPPS